MTKRRNEQGGKHADKGPIERAGNADQFGANGGAAASQQGDGNEDQTSRDGAANPGLGASTSETPGAESPSAGDPNPGDPPSSTMTTEDLSQLNREIAREHGIDLDNLPPVPEAEGDSRVDRSPEFDQSLDRDLQIEGLHDGPGGRKYLVLNLSDDADSLAAAMAYGEKIRQSNPELAADLLTISGERPEQDVIAWQRAVPNPDQASVGLYQKFHVRRADGTDAPGGKHAGAEYFVIDVKGDSFAAAALEAYADACKSSYPLLAADLYRRAGVNVARK